MSTKSRLNFAESSRTGAAAMARIARKNPTELLRGLRESDQTASTERLYHDWLKIVRRDDDYLEAALHHAFTNINHSLEVDEARAKRKVPYADSVQARQAAQATIKEAATREAIDITRRLIPMVMQMTFGECLKAGGWLAKIGKMGKPNQVVGSVLTKDQLLAVK